MQVSKHFIKLQEKLFHAAIQAEVYNASCDAFRQVEFVQLKLLQSGLEFLFSFFFFFLVTHLMIIRNFSDFACKLSSKYLGSLGMPDTHKCKLAFAFFVKSSFHRMFYPLEKAVTINLNSG